MARKKKDSDAVEETKPEPKPETVPNRVRFTQRHVTNIHNFREGLVYVCDTAEQAQEYVSAGVAEAY